VAGSIALYGFPLGQDPQDLVDCDDLAALVDLHVAPHRNDRAARELGLLDLDRFVTVEAVDCVAGEHRAIEVPVRPRDEHVDALEQALAQRLDLVGHRVAQHWPVNLCAHHSRGDDAAPARLLRIVRIAEQRIVISATVREIADIVLGRGLEIFAGLRRLVESEQLALALDVVVGDLVSYGLLPLVALFDIGFRFDHANRSLLPVI
jgi:hypothetical protein